MSSATNICRHGIQQHALQTQQTPHAQQTRPQQKKKKKQKKQPEPRLCKAHHETAQ
jgi:hypothetical protein